MPARRKPAEVTVRQLAPEPVADEEASSSSLYRPVPQLDEFPPKFEMEYVWFTPEIAEEWLAKADQADDFRQRPLRQPQKRRWKNLMQSKRFVHFLPNQAICTDEFGVAINGQHRMHGLTECRPGTQVGFVVIRNVPRWMFAFFDTNSVRTAQDVFHIGGRQYGPRTPSALRLALRYEEFLTGRRNPGGWRHWPLVKDEHQDLDAFYARRDEIQDWYAIAEKVNKSSRVMLAATMVFAFYQSLAWPEGDPELHDFFEELQGPTMALPRQSPVRLLKEFCIDTFHDSAGQMFGKREMHLMLLFRAFDQYVRKARFDKIVWAYGQPMSMPHHPKGHEMAVKNTRIALEELDRDYDESHG